MNIKVTETKAEKTKKAQKPQKSAKPQKLKSCKKFTAGAIVLLQAITSAMLIISLIRLKLLSPIYILATTGALLLLLALTAIKLTIQKSAKTPTKIICIFISLLCTVVSLVAFRYTNSINTLLDKISTDEPTSAPAKEITITPFIAYISGSDSREGIKAKARSDVNILAVVNPEKGKILLVSIPRDTYVQLHGTTGLKDKLTHAGVYGIDMSKSTIEDFLGVKIDHTIKVSFATVVKVVDEIGGIDINSDQEMTLKKEGKNEHCHFTLGTQHIDGDCALRFARERKSYSTGDRHRGENQQQVIASIIDKFSKSNIQLLRIPTILDIAADSFETSLTRDNITDFIRFQLEKGLNWQVESISIDGAGSMQPTYSMGAGRPLYVMFPSESTINTAKTKISEYLAK